MSTPYPFPDTTHLKWLQMAENASKIGHWYLKYPENTLYWSPEVYKIHGLDAKKFTPTLENALDAYHADDRIVVESHIKNSMETQEPFQFQLRLNLPCGTARTVFSQGKCDINEAGELQGVFGIFKDVSAEHKVLQTTQSENEFLRAIINNIPELVFVKDEELKIQLANDAFWNMYGVTPESLIGTTMLEKHPPAEAAKFIEQDRKAFKEGRSETEEQVTDMRGETQTMDTLKSVFTMADGRKLLLGYAKKISHRKRQENAIMQADARFSALFQNSPIPMAIETIEGKFIVVNTAFESFFGYTEAELQTMTSPDVTLPEGREKDQQHIIKLLAREQKNATFNKIYVHKDGTQKPGRVSVSIISIDENSPAMGLAVQILPL